jgi:REP element-mobilizing transposase RayT
LKEKEMARPLRIEYPGAFYHVTSRGNEKRDIFKNRKDREKFLVYLQSSVERYGALIHAYCLMTNHYHLLLETPRGNLSEIMQHINGAYTTYFNVKRKRTGHLFHGRYKAIVVDADEYALELSRYIHLNPVRAGMVREPQEHEWTSYKSYIGMAAGFEWLKTDFILNYFGGNRIECGRKYKQFVEGLLNTEYESPLKAVVASTILGTPEFIAEISEKHVAGKQPDRSVPAVKELCGLHSLDEIVHAVNEILNGQEKLAKKVSIYFCHRYNGAKLKEIGEKFGIGDGAISQASKRLLLQAEKDQQVRMAIENVGKVLDFVKC